MPVLPDFDEIMGAQSEDKLHGTLLCCGALSHIDSEQEYLHCPHGLTFKSRLRSGSPVRFFARPPSGLLDLVRGTRLAAGALEPSPPT